MVVWWFLKESEDRKKRRNQKAESRRHKAKSYQSEDISDYH